MEHVIERLSAYVMGLIITALLAIIAFLGKSALAEIKEIKDSQHNHLYEFVEMRAELRQIKNVSIENKATLNRLNKRSALYWPESEHIKNGD